MSKTSAINMRVEPRQQALLTKAAALLDKDRSSFILEVACREAEQVLLNQRIFHLDENQYVKFENTLSNPIPDEGKLKHLLMEPSPWE